VDARERWQALQTQLSLAREAVESGDRARALAAVQAALALDPQFLAAQSLRDRILAWRDLAPPPDAAPSAPVLPASGPLAQPQEGDRPTRLPLVSTEGYARFEERAKRRRVDKRIDAAKAAIQQKKLRDAAAALNEVLELDPNLPELASLTAAFDNLRRSLAKPKPRRGPWLAAAAAFGATVLGASWLQESRLLQSRPVAPTAPLVARAVQAAPAPATAAPADQPTGTAGKDVSPPPIEPHAAEPADRPAAEPIDRSTTEPVERSTAGPADRSATPPIDHSAAAPIDRPVAAPGRDTTPPPMPSPPPVRASSPAVQPPAQVASVPAPTPIQEVSLPPAPAARPVAPTARAVPEATTTPSVVPATPVVPLNDDEMQVKQVLQRYRVAYEGLDAQSAQDVWPAVNQVALARAFEGLESQRLTFEACNVELQGSHALATCRGTARYVPKVGSRQPRTEPRIWSFALRKIGADWKIDNARAER
jgi:hypothetical protein